MIDIHIKTIPHKNQRYSTVGDYWIDSNGVMQVRVSEMKDSYCMAVIIHELYELFSVMLNKIPIKDIDRYDTDFEDLRSRFSKIIGDQEPGGMVSAPYHKQHEEATKVEKYFCKRNKINWSKYEHKVNSLYEIHI